MGVGACVLAKAQPSVNGWIAGGIGSAAGIVRGAVAVKGRAGGGNEVVLGLRRAARMFSDHGVV